MKMKNPILNLSFLLLILGFTAQANADGLSAEDYMEIQQLYAKYNFAIDSGDAEGYAATFTEDGVFNNFKGKDALIGFVKRYTEGMNGPMRRHWNSNLLVTGDGKTAEGKVYLILLDLSTTPPSAGTTAIYNDTLVKTADGWRFSKRTTTGDPKPAAQ